MSHESLPFDISTIDSQNAYIEVLSRVQSVTEGLVEAEELPGLLSEISTAYGLTVSEMIDMSNQAFTDVRDITNLNASEDTN